MLEYALLNYNDIILEGRWPTGTAGQLLGCNLKITDLSIRHQGTIGVLMAPMIPGNIAGNGVYLHTFVTTQALDHDRYAVEVPVLPSRAVNAAQDVFIIDVVGAAATDDVFVTVVGYTENTPREPQGAPIQSVTLEGYRWPLVKRRV
jgi:hypothetical protein